MPRIDSSALKSLWYDPEQRTLRATFRGTGRSYLYEDVSAEEYDALMAAESRGAWFNQHIRDSHRFQAIDDDAPAPHSPRGFDARA